MNYLPWKFTVVLHINSTLVGKNRQLNQLHKQDKEWFSYKWSVEEEVTTDAL